MGSSSAIRAVGAPARGRTTNGTKSSSPPACRWAAYTPLGMSAGTVHVNDSSHPASSRSSSWKWIAPYCSGARRQSTSVPSQPCPVAARMGRWTVSPCHGPTVSVTREEPMSREKSHAATTSPPASTRGASSLPLNPAPSTRSPRATPVHGASIRRRPHLLPAGERIVRRHRERRRPLGHEVRDEPVPDADAQDGVGERARRRPRATPGRRRAAGARDRRRARSPAPRARAAWEAPTSPACIPRAAPARPGWGRARSSRAGSPGPRRDGSSPPSPPAP